MRVLLCQSWKIVNKRCQAEAVCWGGFNSLARLGRSGAARCYLLIAGQSSGLHPATRVIADLPKKAKKKKVIWQSSVCCRIGSSLVSIQVYIFALVFLTSVWVFVPDSTVIGTEWCFRTHRTCGTIGLYHWGGDLSCCVLVLDLFLFFFLLEGFGGIFSMVGQRWREQTLVFFCVVCF